MAELCRVLSLELGDTGDPVVGEVALLLTTYQGNCVVKCN